MQQEIDFKIEMDRKQLMAILNKKKETGPDLDLNLISTLLSEPGFQLPDNYPPNQMISKQSLELNQMDLKVSPKIKAFYLNLLDFEPDQGHR